MYKVKSLIVSAVVITLSVSGVFSQSSLTTGALTAVPTIRCIGLYWTVTGDANGNATSSVRFRETGSGTWNYAMPMMRMAFVPVQTSTPYRIGDVPISQPTNLLYNKKALERNLFGGSIFHLAPGTSYEIEVSVSDPDGGGATQTISATTRAIPDPGNYGGRTPTPVTGGGSALSSAVASLSPGDILEVFNGSYSGGFTISGNASALNPTIITAAPGQDNVVIQGPGALGISVAGSHVLIKGITIKDFTTGIKAATGTEGVSVTRCKVLESHESIVTYGNKGYYADNHIDGNYSWREDNEVPFEPLSGEGIYFNNGASENVAEYNYITDVGDALNSYTDCQDNDFCGNDIWVCGDDAIEFDYTIGQVRFWGNRYQYTGGNGVTFQPFNHGPAYVVNNIMFVWGADDNGSAGYNLKQRDECSDLVMINNTVVSPGHSDEIPMRTYSRNNLFLNPPERANNAHYSYTYHFEDFMYDRPDVHPMDQDYNAYSGKLKGHAIPINYFGNPNFSVDAAHEQAVIDFHKGPGRTLAGFQTDVGQDLNSVEIILSNVLATAFPDVATLPVQRHTCKVTPPAIDVSIQATSPTVDKGIALPNIIGGYTGTAPDIGAAEQGVTMHYGIRDATTWSYPWSPVYSSGIIGEIEMPAFRSRSIIEASPNPFLNGINIKFPSVSTKEDVTVNIFNTQGQKVKGFFVRAGTAKKSIYWNGKDNAGKLMAKGMYYIKLITGDAVISERIIRLK